MPDLSSLKFVEDIFINPVHCIRLYVDIKTGQKLIGKGLSSPIPKSDDIEMLVKEYEIGTLLKGNSHLTPLGLEYKEVSPIVFYEDFRGISIADVLHHGPFELNTFFNTAIGLTESLYSVWPKSSKNY